MRKYRVSPEMDNLINSLKVGSCVVNYKEELHDEILNISVIAYRDKLLNIEQIKSLRKAIAESLVNSENIMRKMWHNQLQDVFTVLRSCDRAIISDGDEHFQYVCDWELE